MSINRLYEESVERSKVLTSAALASAASSPLQESAFAPLASKQREEAPQVKKIKEK